METKLRILDAAERLFAFEGFEAASLRAIIAAAGTNLASIHYHFGTKENLIRAALKRRFAPINQQRLMLLEDSRKRAHPSTPSIDELLYAFLGPMLQAGFEDSPQGHTVMRLAGRLLIEPGEQIHQIVREQFHEIAQRFVAAFQEALPHLPAEEIAWRLNFTIRSAAKAVFGGIPLKVLSEAAHAETERFGIEEVLDRLIRFTAAGMKATGPNPKRKRAHSTGSIALRGTPKRPRVRSKQQFRKNREVVVKK